MIVSIWSTLFFYFVLGLPPIGVFENSVSDHEI
jgi:hypothetical protein